MNESNTLAADQLQVEYRIKRLIDLELDTIIPEIEQLVVDAKLNNNRRLGRSQFSSLQNVARDTTSVKVILTWIRYQMGRYSAWQEQSFGQSLVTALENLKETATRIAREASTAQVSVDKNDIYLRLVRQYVGQLQRLVIAYQGDVQL